MKKQSRKNNKENSRVYAIGFGPDSRLIKFFKTPPPPRTAGLVSLFIAACLLVFSSISAFNLFYPKTQLNQTAIIRAEQTRVIKASPAVAGGQPIKWVVLVNKQEIKDNQYLLKLPKNSSKIKITSLSQQQAEAKVAQAELNQQTQLTMQERKQLADRVNPKLDLAGINFRTSGTAGLAETRELVFRFFSFIHRFFLAGLEEAASDIADQVIETLTQPEVTVTEDAKLVDLSGQAEEPPAEQKEKKQEKEQEKQQKKEEKQQDKQEKKQEKEQKKGDKKAEPEAPAEEPVVEEQPAPVSVEAPSEEPPAEQPAESEPIKEQPAPSVEPIPVVEIQETPALETVSPSDQEVIATEEVSAELSSTETIEEVVAVEYETPAPTITEQQTDAGKMVTISSGSGEIDCELLNPAKRDSALLYIFKNSTAGLANAVSNMLSALSKFFLADLEQAVSQIVEIITGPAEPAENTIVELAPVPTEQAPPVEETPAEPEESETAKPVLVEPEPAPEEASAPAEASPVEETPAEPVSEPVQKTEAPAVEPAPDDTAYQECLKQQIPLTNVLAFTSIPEIYKVGQEDKINIKWKNNGDRQMEFNAFDLDNNGKLDYVEWVVPHLSEQTFEIIFISKAFELDQNRGIIEDIYDQVYEQDNIWTTVENNYYVRVTFEQILDNTKDITLYAKPTIPGQEIVVEVYPENSTELITTFDIINQENTYKVYLTNLQTNTDVFDLKIIGADLDIDYIVDPAGANSPGTTAGDSDSGGSVTWSSMSNVAAEDGSLANATVGTPGDPMCLSPDTLIATEEGDKAIKDLKIGDLIYSYNFKLEEVELKEVGNVFSAPIARANNQYYHIYFGDRDIKATHDHLLYANNNFVPAEELKVGDILLDIDGQQQLITKIDIEENYTDYVWELSVNDNQNFFANGVLVHNAGVYDHRVRIIKGGSIGSTDKASGTVWPGSLAYTTYGGASDLWGETWTPADINASTFGVAISAYASDYGPEINQFTSYYLKATNFSFAVPTNATIDGITVEIKKKMSFSSAVDAYIDHIRITIAYSGNLTYTWTGTSDSTTWADQGNWDTGDGSAGDDGYPDDNTDLAVINSTAHNIGTPAGGALTIGALTLSSSYTGTLTANNTLNIDDAGAQTGDFILSATGATFDANDQTINIDGNVDMDNTLTLMGSGTWTVAGDFDYVDITTITDETSMLVLTGTAELIGINQNLYNVTIDSGADITVPAASGIIYPTGVVNVNGSLTIDSGEVFTCLDEANMGSAGIITGAGRFEFYATGAGDGMDSKHADSTFNVAEFRIRLPHASAVLAPGTYASALTKIANTTDESVLTLTAAGDYIFTGDFELETTSTGNITLANNTNGPNSITIQGDLIIDLDSTGNVIIDNSGQATNWVIEGSVVDEDTGAGAFTWTKGTGTITLSGAGSGTQTIDFLDKTVEDIVINDSGATKQFTGGVTTDSLTLTAGTADFNGQAITTTGNFTIGTAADVTGTGLGGSTITVGGNFDVAGSSGDLLDLVEDTTAWVLNVTGTANADYVNVAYSDASGGTAITQTNSTDSGNNTNWLFNEAPAISAGPSDSSSATTPTNAGSNVTFTTTATDNESDNYYLAICKTDAITAVNSAAPTCDGGSWCISSSTTASSQASCTYAALTADVESNAWFAFVCDHNSGSLCSSSSQGTGDNGSPFKVNHIPTFTAISTSPDLAGLGQNITFSSTASDTDTDTSSDTVALYVCKSNDFTGSACGASGTWCSSSASASDPSCTYTVLSTDTSGIKTYYGYVVDNHNFETASNPRSSTFTTDIDIPVISDISPTQGIVSSLPSSVSFTLDEAGYCRSSSSDLSYTDMTGANECSGGGTASITCDVSGSIVASSVPQSLSAYISCQDIYGNENSSSNNTNVYYRLPGGGGSWVSFNPIAPVVETVQKTVEKVVEQIVEVPKQLVEQVDNLGRQIAEIVSALRPEPAEKKIAYPPIEESVAEEAPEALAHKLDIVKVKDFGELNISFLPQKLKELVFKFPEIVSTLAKVGITKAADVERLKGVALSFPKLSDLAGVATSGMKTKYFSQEEKAKIPNEYIFARAADNRIDINMKVALVGEEEVVQSFNVAQNRQISLVVKPRAPAKSVEGIVILLPKSAPVSENDMSKAVAGLLGGIEAIAAEAQSKNQEILLDRFVYEDDDHDGIYTASIQMPGREGKYDIRTVIAYENENTPTEQISIVAVVDPEGYIYEDVFGKQARIKDAIVSIYWLNPETEQYELWPAEDFQQENPRKTDETGKYSFLVPPGHYYLAVEKDGYSYYQGKPFQVSQGIEVNADIQLMPKNWLAKIFSLEKILMCAVILLLLSIFIVLSRLLMRKRRLKKKKAKA